VLGLGRALSLPVLAEGVETAAELAFLESVLCNEAQGYLLGRPGDIAGFRQLTHGVDAAEDHPSTVSLVPKASSM
jgi:EAL domain-containing protein (putative c-di-GMP-specific phosphodiesterase class I)